MASGQYEKAIPIYRALVEAVPRNAGLMTNLGVAYHMAGHEEEAVAELTRALKLDPHNVPAHLYLGYAYLSLRQPAKAVAPLQIAVRADPSDADARTNLAQALFALNRFLEAASQFEKLSQADPRNPEVWHWLGLCYQELSQENFDELQRIASGSACWLALVAENRLKAQQYSSAFYLYRHALAKDPALHGAHAALVEIYQNTGHPDWAETESEREKKLDPADCKRQALECDFLAGHYEAVVKSPLRTPEAYYWKTRASNALALQAFSRLSRLPPSAELHELIARMQFNERHYVEAAKEWREALKLSPDSLEIQKQLAIALNKSDDLEGAREVLEALVKRQPGSPELSYLLGETLLNSQRIEEAIRFLEKAVALDPKLLAAQGALGRAYLQVNKAGQAIPHLKLALPIDEDGSLHYQLARAYQMTHRQELAKQTLAAYQRISKSLQQEQQATQEELKITPP